jgi:hypothetical protein
MFPRPVRLRPPTADLFLKLPRSHSTSPVSLPDAAAAIPDLALAAAFIVTWISPYALGTRAVWHLVMVILLEFIVMHSSAFVGVVGFSDLSRSRRTCRGWV